MPLYYEGGVVSSYCRLGMREVKMDKRVKVGGPVVYVVGVEGEEYHARW